MSWNRNVSSEAGDDIVNEGAEYSSKSGFNKPELIFTTVKTCVDKRSKEMKAGYYNIHIDKQGMPSKVWIPDARQEFISAVTALKVIMSPEINEDDQYKEILRRYKEEEKRIFRQYCYHDLEYKRVGGKLMMVESGRLFIPEINSSVKVPNKNNPQVCQDVVGGWDTYINAYWNEMVQLYDLLLASLNKLIHKKNYFKGELSW